MLEYTKLVNIEFLERVYYTSQITLALISSVILIATFIYGIIQYRSQKKHAKIIKAADLAKLYEETIIKDISLIIGIFSKFNIDEIIEKKIRLDKLEYFDQKELYSFIDKEEVARIVAFTNIIICKEDGSIELEKKRDKEDKTIQIIESNHLHNKIGTLMNKLEYICIHFNSGVAQDITVYQSLHTTLFLTVQYMYIFLAMNNLPDSGRDKLYTNIMNVYKKWRKIYQKQQKKEDKIKRKLEKMQKDVAAKTTL